MRRDSLRELTVLLDQEHDALLRGAVERIPQLTATKEKLLQRIPMSNASPGDLVAVSRLITRNQALLSAATKGIKAAEATLEALKNSNSESVVYDRSGVVSRLRQDGKGLSQKM